MIWILMIIAFLLDGVVSNFVSMDSLFLPLFSIIILVVIYPYFNRNDYQFFGVSIIYGLIFDLVYTNLVFYNFFLFFIVAFIIAVINFFITDTLLHNIYIGIIVIVIYRLFSYILAIMTTSIRFSLPLLLKSIYSSLILNIIFLIVTYLLANSISKKFKILKKI